MIKKVFSMEEMLPDKESAEKVRKEMEPLWIEMVRKLEKEYADHCRDNDIDPMTYQANSENKQAE